MALSVRTGLRLEVVSEKAIFREVLDIKAFLQDWESSDTGRYFQVQEAEQINELAFRKRIGGHTGGNSLPTWHDGAGGRFRSGTTLFRVPAAYYMPQYGAVIDENGRVFQSSIEEALYFTPTLAKLPDVTLDKSNAAYFYPPPTVPVIAGGTVFIAWGGLHNYGHYAIDCISALTAVIDQDLIPKFPPLVPHLFGWQKGLLDLLLEEDMPYVLIEEPLVKVIDVVFASPMAHFLHAPNSLLQAVRRRICSHVSSSNPAKVPKRLYFSRLGDSKRKMINEAELELALKARGVDIIHPEHFSAFEQVELMRNSEIVIGTTGAALANCLFAADGCRVVEIQPENFRGIWVRSLCDELNLSWHGFFCDGAVEDRALLIEGHERKGADFEFKLSIPQFLEFLDPLLKLSH